MTYDPPGTVAGAKRVNEQMLPEAGGPVQQGGMLTVTPAGTLLAWSVTPALNPPEVVIVIGNVVAGPPGHIEARPETESVKDWA
jgi:hypothetical protein